MTQPLPPDLSAQRFAMRLLLGACVFLLLGVHTRGIDPDELEHLHAGFCVWNGEVPYRDFFEHHAPALYYLIQPLFLCFGPTLTVLWCGRLLMLGFSVGTLWLTKRLAERTYGESAGWMAAALLAIGTIFISKGNELRPDVPATFFIIGAANVALLRQSDRSWRHLWCVGALLGLATLFTQKGIVPAVGLIFALGVLTAIRPAPPSVAVGNNFIIRGIRTMGDAVVGMVLVWLLTGELFACAGAGRDFWISTWYQLWTWNVRSGRWEYLRPTLLGDMTMWFAAVVEAVSVIRQLKHGGSGDSRLAILIVALIGAASIPAVKAAYPQYYLLWMPFVAILAAGTVCRFLQPAEGRSHRGWLAGAALVLGGIQIFGWLRAFHLGSRGPFPRLTAGPELQIFFAIVIALLSLTVVVSAWKDKQFAARCCLCLLGMAYGLLRLFDQALWSNGAQAAAMERVHARIAVGERVFDGFTGLGALRPHAWYYWWINPYSLALVPPEELQTGLLERLQAAPPAGILVDDNLKLLPEPIWDWIVENYEPTDDGPLWIPKSKQIR